MAKGRGRAARRSAAATGRSGRLPRERRAPHAALPGPRAADPAYGRGNTVNIASRLESTGEPGRINISASTYELVRDRFDCEYRGRVSAKNAGEIDMYFVSAPRETGAWTGHS